MTPEYPYVYFWNRMGRKGQHCDIEFSLKSKKESM